MKMTVTAFKDLRILNSVFQTIVYINYFINYEINWQIMASERDRMETGKKEVGRERG